MNTFIRQFLRLSRADAALEVGSHEQCGPNRVSGSQDVSNLAPCYAVPAIGAIAGYGMA